MSELKVQIAAGTNVGLIRTNNEDNFIVCPDLATSDWKIPQSCDYKNLGEFGALLVVADGMGGANAGEVASAIAVETIQELFSCNRLSEIVKDDNSVQEFMKDVVKTADLRIFEKSKQDSNTRGMGTTVVMAWILDGKVFVCWCGDSRCYMLNRHKGLVRLSKDHSYVQELIDRGELDPDLAMNHPYSNVITRCLGDMENRAVPDTRIFQLHNGDTILLCSDGLSGLCSDSQILDLLIKTRDNAETCKDELITAALGEGGHDNVTVALCNVDIPNEEDDTEDDALPKGTLPPTPLSETLKSDKPHRKPKQKKGNFRKVGFFFLLMLVIAFLTVKWHQNSNNSHDEDGVNADTSLVRISQDKEDSIVNNTMELKNGKMAEKNIVETVPAMTSEVSAETNDTTSPITTDASEKQKDTESEVIESSDSVIQN